MVLREISNFFAACFDIYFIKVRRQLKEKCIFGRERIYKLEAI